MILNVHINENKNNLYIIESQEKSPCKFTERGRYEYMGKV